MTWFASAALALLSLPTILSSLPVLNLVALGALLGLWLYLP